MKRIGLCFPFLLLNRLLNRVMNQFDAAEKGDLPQLRVALTMGNVNDVAGGWTALYYAACNGHDDCVIYCLEMGADVNASDSIGRTPLHVASMWGHVNVARVLLDAGALVDARNVNGWTALHHAIEFERVDVARLLVDRGANVSSMNWCPGLPRIPDWISEFIESRSNCRTAAIVIIGIHKYRRTTMTGNNDINVLRLISKHIWSTRMGGMWVAPPIEAKKLRLNTIPLLERL
jgi:ankyrin repeat protein